MAYSLFKTERVFSFEQPRETEIKQVAGSDGVVTEEEVLIQEGFKLYVDAKYYQDTKYFYNTTLYNEEARFNRSDIKIELIVTSESTDNQYSYSFSASNRSYETDGTIKYPGDYIIGVAGIGYQSVYSLPDETKARLSKSGIQVNSSTTFQPNTTTTKTIEIFETSGGINAGTYKGYVWHNADGTKDIKVGIDFEVKVYGINGNDSGVKIGERKAGLKTISLKSLDKSTSILTADNFTDEENPTVAYKPAVSFNATNSHYYSYYPFYSDIVDGTKLRQYLEDIPTQAQICISLDGTTPLVPYRDIDINGSNYTFNLTDEEREALRVNAQGSDSVPVYFITKTTRNVLVDPARSSGGGTVYHAADFYSTVQRIFTVVGCNPTLNPTVKDIKPETLALTGDENTFVRYESMAEYAINATASKHATIVSQSVQCGSKTISNLPNGVIDDVESGTFIFNVTDSRGMGASSSVFKNLVEYVKPTCYQKAEIAISGETGANIKVTANGNYYNGSFGAADNTLKLEVRYTDDNGNMGAWKTLSGTPTYNGTTYKLEATIGGFNYGRAYVFQCRATDKLNIVESSQYTIRMLPVFDWSEYDFNFNVPVNIGADKLSMHNETIIRHSNETNNTVLSAANGNIYVRPGGTDDTSGETIFYNNGNVKFNGTVTFADGSTAGGAKEYADYVIATGSEAMGSNGTWYWRKWASGTAEAWGCRNFGNMAITTAWGNLYRSAIFTQDLPDNVFIRTPDAININIVHSNFGGWICKHEQTAPSAVTTGSFIFVRPASATATPTNIGFYIVGEWK